MENVDQINIEEGYKDRIIKVWNQYLKEEDFKDHKYRKYPIAPKFVKKNSLLFIGINPSFKEGTALPNTDIEFYNLDTSNESKDIPYFEKFKDIAKYCKTDWTHLDLFYIRESKQNVIDEFTFNNIPFLSAQLDISFDIIEKAQPKLIVVSNALASEFFGKKKTRHNAIDKIWKGYSLFFEDNPEKKIKSTFDPSIGTYRIDIGGKSVPIIFSGMLSGQRALDIGSLERLKWQIKFILDGRYLLK